MSYYAFTVAAIAGLQREFWGRKIPQPDGSTIDTGVNEFAEELIARLASQDPIQLAGTIKLVGPANGPTIQIINGGGIIDGDGNSIPPSGFTGSITVLTDVDVQGSGTATPNGCDIDLEITITTTKTTQTLTFVNGVMTGVS